MGNSGKKYFVVWRVELTAEDSTEAAMKAAYIQELMAKGSGRNFNHIFEVSDEEQDSCPYSDVITLQRKSDEGDDIEIDQFALAEEWDEEASKWIH